MIIRPFILAVLRNKAHSGIIQGKNICEVRYLWTSGTRCFHKSRYCLGINEFVSKKEKETNSEDDKAAAPLDKEKANALVLKLSEEERSLIYNALKEFEAQKRKQEFAGQLAAHKWRSKFGRPSKVPSLGDVDPTGSYCPFPEDWLLKKYAEIVPKPNRDQLTRVLIHNAIPFIGFGFLDNACMILCGDYIEVKLGAVMTISTMAAAALGNWLSDILGLGSAYYVERFAAALGFKSPDLSPIQMNMASTRRFANMGRALGITIGCLLGMTPLLILKIYFQGR